MTTLRLMAIFHVNPVIWYQTVSMLDFTGARMMELATRQ